MKKEEDKINWDFYNSSGIASSFLFSNDTSDINPFRSDESTLANKEKSNLLYQI